MNRNYEEFITKNDPATSNNPNETLLLSELSELLENALAKLPENYRIVFEMHQFKNKDYTEIAETLHISVSTAKRYKKQVLKILQKEFKDYLPFLLCFFYDMVN